MTFRKKVKKILSKLTSSRGKSNKASSSAPVSELSTSRPGTTTTINPANPPGEIFPRRPSPPSPPTPPNNPPKNYSFPKGVHPSYRPPGIIDQDNPDENRAVLSSYHDHSRLVPEEERGPYIRDFDEGTRRRGRGQRHKLGEGGSPYIRDFDEGTRSRGRPGTSAYPEEVSERYHSSEYDRKAISQYSPIDRPKSRKSFSNSLASSDYDHHSTTQSLHPCPVPSSGKELMQNHIGGTDAGSPPVQISHEVPRRLPISALVSANKLQNPSPVKVPTTPTSETADVTWSQNKEVVHEAIRPIEQENVTSFLTREHHHHELYPTIQPIVETHHLPPKHYLESPGGTLESIHTPEPGQYGEPVWSGDRLIARDDVREDMFQDTFKRHETVRTRLPTPQDAHNRRPATPILPLPGHKENELLKLQELQETEGKGKGKELQDNASGQSSYTSSMGSYDHAGMRDSRVIDLQWQQRIEEEERWEGSELKQVINYPDLGRPRFLRPRTGTFGKKD